MKGIQLSGVVGLLWLTSHGIWAQNVCKTVVSSVEDPTAVQVAGGAIPLAHQTMVWTFPSENTYLVHFSGKEEQNALHEGVDYVHNHAGTKEVKVRAASKGIVVYVREGCPQTDEFTRNLQARECGAGWGNHIVVRHGDQLFTRYGHLKPGTLLPEVGDSVQAGEWMALMGNSGRSETRHLHFELGTRNASFDPCGMSQNFDRVYDPNLLSYQVVASVRDLLDDPKWIKVISDVDSNALIFRLAPELGEVNNILVYDLSGCLLVQYHHSGGDEVAVPIDPILLERTSKPFYIVHLQTRNHLYRLKVAVGV